MLAETDYLLLGMLCYAAAASFVLAEVLANRRFPVAVLQALFLGSLLVGAAIAERWAQVGHGPFLDLYEILLSSLFSLGFLYALAYWIFPSVRAGAVFFLAVLVILATWAVQVPRDPGPLPATYETAWLWAHVVAGKLFLVACLVAASLAAVGVLPSAWRTDLYRRHSLQPEGAEALVWRWTLGAFLFHSAMLIAGAVWAQDAWGRYWAWDPLETWAFSTWLVMVAALHAKLFYRVPRRVGYLFVVAVFVLAFMTFFGLPFVSTAPHQGAV